MSFNGYQSYGNNVDIPNVINGSYKGKGGFTPEINNKVFEMTNTVQESAKDTFDQMSKFFTGTTNPVFTTKTALPAISPHQPNRALVSSSIPQPFLPTTNSITPQSAVKKKRRKTQKRRLKTTTMASKLVKSTKLKRKTRRKYKHKKKN